MLPNMPLASKEVVVKVGLGSLVIVDFFLVLREVHIFLQDLSMLQIL